MSRRCRNRMNISYCQGRQRPSGILKVHHVWYFASVLVRPNGIFLEFEKAPERAEVPFFLIIILHNDSLIIANQRTKAASAVVKSRIVGVKIHRSGLLPRDYGGGPWTRRKYHAAVAWKIAWTLSSTARLLRRTTLYGWTLGDNENVYIVCLTGSV